MTASNSLMKAAVFLLLVPTLAAATGCRSMQPVDLERDAMPTIGEFVEITHRDGRRIQGRVQSVVAETITLESGQATRIDDMAELRAREISAGRTVAAGAMGWLAIAIVTASITFMNFIGVL